MQRNPVLFSMAWSGLARRRELWAFLVAALLLIAAFVLAELWIAGASPKAPRFVYVLLALLLVPQISLGLRRLHDMGWSGGWLVFGFLPWVGLLFWAWLLFAPSSNRPHVPDTPVPLHFLGVVLTGLLVLLLASRAFWAPYWIPSNNMKPSLLPGDYLMARFVDADGVQRGDVIVFRGGAPARDRVARVVGLSGDTVQMRAGVIVLNGAEVPQKALPPFMETYAAQGPAQSLPRCGNAPVGQGGLCETQRFWESLPGGRGHEILNIMAQSAMDDTQEVTVPPGQFYVLGDNRDDSLDSRFARDAFGVGFVDGADVIARVRRVLYSAEGSSLLAVWSWRAGRFWRPIE
ncbi:MAG: signal peptidase I [Paracoccaceae bacterium]